MSMARLRRIASLVHKARRCPFCGWRGFRFEPFGNSALRRDDAACPICGSLERHRAAFLLLRDRIPNGQKVLHAAPERLMIPWLVGLAREYLNVDLNNPAMRRMDLTDIDLPDNSKTLVWCSHVLEHIPDDGKALSEIYRVLEPGGLLVVQVPIGGQTTFEDASITSDQDRLTNFLQEDHVRLYGLDLRQRIEKAGFECEVLSTADLSQAEQVLYGLHHPVFREVFLCRRPKPA
jgi:predicted SAM-dependent methyltransferase